MLTTFASYKLITRDLDLSLQQKSEEGPVALETANYLDKIGQIKTIDEFINDHRVFNFAMTAFGLEEMAHAKAYMKKVLVEGTAESDSFVNRLNDDRFLNFAKTFNFERDGEAATSTTAAQQGVVDRYVRQKLEISAGQDNEGVRLALYFLREAPNITSVYSLMADAALWEVITTTFGFPDEMAAADIDKQAAAVLARLDINDLKDPEKLDKFLTRFAAIWEATEVAVQDPTLSLFGAGGSSADLDLDLIMTLNSVRRGGA